MMEARLFLVAAVLWLGLSATLAAARPGGPPLPITRAYWRGTGEVSPGPFLSTAPPAATNVTVVCDRWPDASDLRQFGLDAARLSGAKTDSEKAQAVWQWMRRFTMCTDGTAPLEPYQGGAFDAQGYIADPIKVLNVYGFHWCDGLSRAVEAVWRAMDGRAEKFACHSHTLADLWYRDDDGVGRWHLFDCSDGGFAMDRAHRRVLSTDEITTDIFTGYYYGYSHCAHLPMPTHRVELSFRTGEKLERDWSNWGQPYENHIGGVNGPIEAAEHGPYAYTYGNGRWTYRPDLSTPDWVNGLGGWEGPQGLAKGKLQPAEAGKPGVAQWHFRTPYIVSDAEVHLRLFRQSPDDAVRLYVSDGGEWKLAWEAPADAVGSKDVVVPVCDKVTIGNDTKVPAGFVSPFGRYSYDLRLELVAKRAPEDCRVEGIEFQTVVQQNHYALPQLQPGVNHITVKGDLTKGAALKVTYAWDDPAGKDRRNVTVVERTPYTYEITVGGRKWEDGVCKSLTIEAVAATGAGNRTEVKEHPAAFAALPPPPPAADTRLCMRVTPDPTTLLPVGQLLANLQVPEKRHSALRGLGYLREPKAFEPIKQIVYTVQPPTSFESLDMEVKELGLATLYQVDRAEAKPVLLDLLTHPDRSKWAPASFGFNGTYCGNAGVIGYMAAEAGWKDFVPGLVQALQDPGCEDHGARAILRSLGRLGDPRAAEAVRRFLDERIDGDTMSVAALAAGQVGDRQAVPRLRELLNNGYPPTACNAAIALGLLKDGESFDAIRPWLYETRDENYRAAAADALGAMGDARARPALKAALVVEPFPWVREKMTDALNVLGG